MLQLNRGKKPSSSGGGVSSHSSYKKKVKDPRKPKNVQYGGHDGHGHAPGCDCEYCGGDFPVRTHLLLDMSAYSRLDSDMSRKPGVIAALYNFFRFGKKASQMGRDDYRSHAKVKFSQQDDEKFSGPLEPVVISNLKQDCFLIPITKLNNFFPAGHPIPSKDANRLRMVETNEPDIKVMFHMMGPAVPLTPTLSSPLIDLRIVQQEWIIKMFKATVSALNLGATLQGMVLINLEKGGEMGAVEFPFMIVWVIDSRKCDPKIIASKVKNFSLDALDPAKTGFTCSHYVDSFEEVACLARPPIDTIHRKASTPTTGYIISVFKVFEGDDGEKFERNWLGWSGARALYCSMMDNDVGLRRLTLHKSSAFKGFLTYILLCDCSNFLVKMNSAVQAIPRLRMRLCGETGLYRPICTV